MKIRREVYLWFDTAIEDLEDALFFINYKKWFRAAFFAHQAVEKALKALFFIYCRVEPPKIHTVSELYRMLRECGFKLPQELEDQIYIFNKYYTITRYPDAANGLPSESVDEIEARRAVDLAEKIIEYIREEIKRRDN